MKQASINKIENRMNAGWELLMRSRSSTGAEKCVLPSPTTITIQLLFLHKLRLLVSKRLRQRRRFDRSFVLARPADRSRFDKDNKRNETRNWKLNRSWIFSPSHRTCFILTFSLLFFFSCAAIVIQDPTSVSSGHNFIPWKKELIEKSTLIFLTKMKIPTHSFERIPRLIITQRENGIRFLHTFFNQGNNKQTSYKYVTLTSNKSN